MTWQEALGVGIWSLALFAQLLSTGITLFRLRTPKAGTKDAARKFEPITILKPLKGVDDGLIANLESFFALDYPSYELIFSIKDSKDPAVAVVRELIRRHPKVEARLILGAVEAGVNPKVCNLIKSYAAARHDWVLISDSNTRVEPDFLQRMMAESGPHTGVVTAVVSGRDAIGLGGHLETVSLNAFFARGMYLADSVGQACVMGKAMLFKRSIAARFGGLEALANYLAEDYMLGKKMEAMGLRVRVASLPVNQYVGKYSVRDYWLRQIRWGRIRKVHGPAIFAVEPLLGCLVSGILGAFAVHSAYGMPPLPIFMALHLATWALCDFWVVRKMAGKVDLQVPLAWGLRELMALPTWAAIAAGNTVEWRGQRLRILPGGLVEKVVGEQEQHGSDAFLPLGSSYQQSPSRRR